MLTSVVAGTVDYGVILFLVPPWVLFLTGERRAHFCHLTSVLAAPARVHSAPVQPGTSKGREKKSRQTKGGWGFWSRLVYQNSLEHAVTMVTY